MESTTKRPGDKQLYLRLVAVWVVCEGFLGGILHGVKLPVSGLIVGSCAVVCICFLAFYFPKKGSILKATIVVLIFKMMLSPHTPPAAYFAVFFQGFSGELLFANKRFFKASCVVLGVIALVESALQGILMLVILYGNGLWSAVNVFVNKITHQQNSTDYSLIFATAYVLLHAAAGLFAGLYAVRLLKETGKNRLRVEPLPSSDYSALAPAAKKKSNARRFLLLVVWIALLLVYLQSVLGFGEPLLPKQAVVQLLLRSLFIFLSWYFVVSPLLLKVLKNWLSNKQARWKDDVEQILRLLPTTKLVFVKSWELSSGRSGLARISEWFRLVMTHTLHDVGNA